jgi:HAE1 family hydrophobic/amphiphilic exporter-1
MPGNTKILETSEKVSMFEEYVREAISADDLKSISTIIGGGGVSLESFIGGGGNVSENIAQMTVNLASQDMLEQETQLIRSSAEEIFGADNVTVSAASLNEQGFGGFALVLSGPQDDLEAIDADVINTLNAVDGLTNITSTLAQLQAGGGDTTSYLRVNRETALSYSGELETEDTIGVAQQAIQAIAAMPNLPDTLKVSQGFQSELQSEGFLGVVAAMGIAMAIVVLILMVTFGSVVHWLDIMLSVIVAPVGAAVALTLTDSVLGVSALIGMLMLIGIVVTNAVVLIDRVQSNRRERGLELYDALVEAGGRRVRPIVMTAFATIIALIPLAVGLSEGAIIAAELGIVVIGGLFSSTLLTLIVVPVAYSLLAPVHKFTLRLVGR